MSSIIGGSAHAPASAKSSLAFSCVTIFSSWAILCCSAVGLVDIGAGAGAVVGAGGGHEVSVGHGLEEASESMEGL